MRLRIKKNGDDLDIFNNNQLIFWGDTDSLHILTYCHPLSRIFDTLIYNRDLKSSCSTEIKVRLILGLVLL